MLYFAQLCDFLDFAGYFAFTNFAWFFVCIQVIIEFVSNKSLRSTFTEMLPTFLP